LTHWRYLGLLCCAGLLVGCQRMPETYAPPVQRQPFENFRPYRVTRMVEMADGDADARIVQDIPKGGDASWRWAGQHPTVTVTLQTVENLAYSIDFTIADATFKTTGPVTLTFEVNGRELGSERYTAAGMYHFEKVVPAGWLEAGKDTTAGAKIDKVWTSPDDGAKLGFILTRIGFRQAHP
jgi:hypothetical protein